MKVAENKVTIVGILQSKSDLTIGHSESSNDDYIRGNITVRVDNGNVTNIIPINVFAMKHKKNSNDINPAWTSINAVKDRFNSAEEVGLEKATRVSVSGASLSMNSFVSNDGNVRSYIQIRASFFNEISDLNKFNPTAIFDLEFVAMNDPEEIDDGRDAGKMKVKAIVPLYNGKVTIIPLTAVDDKVKSVIGSSWSAHGCYKCRGRINFSTTTETIEKEQDFGDPIIEERTTNVKELIITGGSRDDSEAFEPSEVSAAVKAYNKSLEELKENNKPKEAPAAGKAVADWGF